MGKPWEDAPDLWRDEAEFMSKFLRSSVRKIWSRHPIKHRYVKSRTAVAVQDAIEQGYPIGCKLTKQTKLLRQCELCEQWWPMGRMQVDHIDGGYGYTTYEEYLAWMQRMLWVGYEDIRLICKDCHGKVNTMQRTGCTWEQVEMYQEIAAFNKLKAKPMQAKLRSLGLPTGRNEEERKQIFFNYQQEKYNG